MIFPSKDAVGSGPVRVTVNQAGRPGRPPGEVPTDVERGRILPTASDVEPEFEVVDGEPGMARLAPRVRIRIG
jgi:hypothetical protein